MFIHVFVCWSSDFSLRHEAWSEEKEDRPVASSFAFMLLWGRGPLLRWKKNKGIILHILSLKVQKQQHLSPQHMNACKFFSPPSVTYYISAWDVHLHHCIPDGDSTWWLTQTGAHCFVFLMDYLYVYEAISVCWSNYMLINVFIITILLFILHSLRKLLIIPNECWEQ